MKLSIKKILLFIVLPLIIFAAAFGYYLYNQGPVDIKQSSGIKIAAEDLYHIFSTDSATAQQKYSNEVLTVYGQINAVNVNTENKQIVTLNTNTDGAFINCVMEENIPAAKAGETITIKGLCSGIGKGEPDLGIKGDVYLSRCFAEN